MKWTTYNCIQFGIELIDETPILPIYFSKTTTQFSHCCQAPLNNPHVKHYNLEIVCCMNVCYSQVIRSINWNVLMKMDSTRWILCEWETVKFSLKIFQINWLNNPYMWRLFFEQHFQEINLLVRFPRKFKTTNDIVCSRLSRNKIKWITLVILTFSLH